MRTVMSAAAGNAAAKGQVRRCRRWLVDADHSGTVANAGRSVHDDFMMRHENHDAVRTRLRLYADRVFECRADAEIWFADPNPALGGQAPEALMATENGRRAVELVLRRIDYGDYS
jgi:hypothetical protein